MIALGNVAVGAIHDWEPAPGSVVSWHPSPATLAKAREAPISAVPASYQQTRHVSGFREHAARGIDRSRLCILAWDIPGRCDTRAMTYVLNAHLRRHDTYRSWFEYTDAKHVVRHTIRDPADIELVPVERGELTPAQWREYILATPSPLHWGCFSFALIQRADHFTVCAAVDHLHVDAMYLAMAFMELHTMYAALAGGGAPIALPDAGSYDDYCVRQRRYTSALVLDSPPVAGWIEFFENNDGTLPDFPLPLGDPSVPRAGELLTVRLMNAHQMARFESACVNAGARFCGGVLACAALAEYELTGAQTYYGMTPTDTRGAPAEFLTTGWFTGHIPITVPVSPASFGDTARAAQVSFDSGRELANVPFERVLELAPWLRRPQFGFPMLSFLDVGIAPLSGAVATLAETSNARFYSDGRVPGRVCIWVNRFEKETTVTAFFPNNPIAHESVARYLAAMKSVYARVAEGRGAMAPQRHGAQQQRQPA